MDRSGEKKPTQSHKKWNAAKRHSSSLDSAGTTLLHKTPCPSVCGAALPLPFPIPAPCLPLLLSGGRAERVVRPGGLLPGAPHLLRLQGHVPLPKAALASKSTCSKVTCWKCTTAEAKPTRSPPPAVCSGCDNPPSLLIPVDLPMGAGDSSAEGLERPAISSPKISQQFSVRNCTSAFTCTHESLAFRAGA